MRSIDNKFYKSSSWIKCRASYISEHPLCERCLKKGIISPGEIVHHKIHLTTENYLDPTISLNHENLETVCRDCHNKEHFGDGVERRWEYVDGVLTIKGQDTTD